MNEQSKLNLACINSLLLSPVKSVEAQEILVKRVRIARREIENLRDFANLGKGRPADHCNLMADEIENALIEMGFGGPK